MDKTFADWEQGTANKYGIRPVKVRTIWAVGQGIAKSIRPATDSGRKYIDDSGKLTDKGKEIYDDAEKARISSITKSLTEIGPAIQNGIH